MTRVSVVVPLYNEEQNILLLAQGIQSALAHFSYPWELILVNDGSQDGTLERLRSAADELGKHVRIVDLQRNFGQTAALQAGIDVARGEILVTLDGDLQNDPLDIPRMVEQLLEEDLDLLAGWRKDRKDSLWMRKVPSRLANKLIGRLSGVQLNDYGCTLKVFRMDVLRNVRLYGEMHRFIPAWIATYTSPGRIKETVVRHHPRQFGVSKYGLTRVYRVLLDLFSVYFFMRFKTKPAHFFGKIGLLCGGVGGGVLLYLAFLKIMLGESIGQRPLLMVGVMLALVSIQFITTGMLAELLSRTYYESSDSKPYIRRDVSSIGVEGASWFEPPGQ